MCKSIKTSLATFIVSAISMAICLLIAPDSNSVKFVALFIMVSASMQIGDALIWRSIYTKNNALNAFVSRYVLLAILLAELAVSYYGVRHFFGWQNRLFEMALWIFMAIFVLGWFWGCYDNPVTRANSADGGYLQWCNMNMYSYMKLAFVIFFFAPIFIGMPNSFMKYVILGAGIATFIIHFANDTFGSRWCWSSNVVAILLLVIVVGSYLYKKA